MPSDLQESSVPLAEIAQGPGALELFLDRNQKSLIVLGILITLGTAAYVVYRGIEKSRQETAGEAFTKAEDLAALQSVVTEHTDTAAGRSAMVLLADKQWAEGQQDAAIETLRKFIAANPEHPALPTAQASLGSKLMTQGKSGDAAKIFQQIVDAPEARFIAPYALISLGDIAKLAGDTDKAQTFYNRVKNDFPESNFVETANLRISALKAKPPVEIEAPPKPKAPADPISAIKAAMPPGVSVSSEKAPAPAPEAPAANAPQKTTPEPGSGTTPEPVPANPQQ